MSVSITEGGAELLRPYADQLAGQQTFSLELLRHIDGTCDALLGIKEQVLGFAHVGGSLIAMVNDISDLVLLDSNGEIKQLLSEIIDKEPGLLTILKSKREAATRAVELSDYHRESIVDAYTGAIEAVEGLRDILFALREAIASRDASMRSRHGPFKTFEELEVWLDN